MKKPIAAFDSHGESYLPLRPEAIRLTAQTRHQRWVTTWTQPGRAGAIRERRPLAKLSPCTHEAETDIVEPIPRRVADPMAERKTCASLNQPPPRTTREEPVKGRSSRQFQGPGKHISPLTPGIGMEA